MTDFRRIMRGPFDDDLLFVPGWREGADGIWVEPRFERYWFNTAVPQRHGDTAIIIPMGYPRHEVHVMLHVAHDGQRWLLEVRKP